MQRTQLRIVAGTLRGRKLFCGVHPGMRPTPQMVREALFSILGGKLTGRHFVDVFAGTGVVGLEAISRDATRTLFVERDPKQVAEILRYLERFGVRDRAQVLRADVYRWAERWIAPAEPTVVFLSPPFVDFSRAMPEFADLCARLLEKVSPGSTVVVQGEEGFPIDEMPDPAAWDVRRYGRNLLLFWDKPSAEPE